MIVLKWIKNIFLMDLMVHKPVEKFEIFHMGSPIPF